MSLKVLLLFFICLIACTRASLLQQFMRTLPRQQRQVDQAIVKDFLRYGFSSRTLGEVLEEFNSYKKRWTERMVEFLIRQLEISEESAIEARKNPESYKINYETYKLFTSVF